MPDTSLVTRLEAAIDAAIDEWGHVPGSYDLARLIEKAMTDSICVRCNGNGLQTRYVGDWDYWGGEREDGVEECRECRGKGFKDPSSYCPW